MANGEVGVWGKPGSDAFLRLCYSAGDVSSVLAPCYRTGAIRVVGAEKKVGFYLCLVCLLWLWC